MNNKNKAVFIGGKQIGVNCLNILLKIGIKPKLVIPNMDDLDVSENWHDSLSHVAKINNLDLFNGSLKNPDTILKIKNINPDIIFCIGSNQIVPQDIIEIPKNKIINIHPALLPKYRGRFSTAHAIFNNDKKNGVTLHYIDKRMDSGPILFQQEYEISENDTAKEVYDNFTKVGTELFVKFIKNWINGVKMISFEQDEKLTSVCKGLPNKGEIDWNWDGKKILRFIRSMTFPPFSPVSFNIGDKKMVIVEEKYFKGFK